MNLPRWEARQLLTVNTQVRLDRLGSRLGETNVCRDVRKWDGKGGVTRQRREREREDYSTVSKMGRSDGKAGTPLEEKKGRAFEEFG